VNWVAIVGLVGSMVAGGCSREPKSAAGQRAGAGAPRGRGPAAFPVEVVPVSGRPVVYTVTAVGSVDAFEIVQVTARVPGVVEKIHFREGTRVREGEVLVEIEPERYVLAVDEAGAALEKARAALAEAEAGLARREGANERTPGLIPGEELDAWRTRVLTARAEVTAQEAARRLAERNADDALVRSPFGGTIQSRNVQTGEYVQPGTLLTTLVRREPLLLRFQVPESEAARLAPGMPARFTVRHAEDVFEASLVHVAESAHPSSRMVDVTAEIRQPSDRLRPGAFAEVTVPVGAAENAPVIPQTAVRPSERGFLAFVVERGLARERVLELGLRTPEGLVEVRSGLAPAESLVVRGAEALADGARVRVVASVGAESPREIRAGKGAGEGEGPS
jgi:multidrug efflux system membrane fusion protein